MPRQRDIEAAVAAYNAANPLTQLPRSAARLLVAMFLTSDVCQRSFEDIVGEGFSKSRLPGALRRLTAAGFLSRQRGSGVASAYRLHLPPLVRR